MRLERVLLLPAAIRRTSTVTPRPGIAWRWRAWRREMSFRSARAEVAPPGEDLYRRHAARAAAADRGGAWSTSSARTRFRRSPPGANPQNQVFAVQLCGRAARRQGDARVPEGARVRWLDGDAPQVSSTLVRERAAGARPAGRPDAPGSGRLHSRPGAVSDGCPRRRGRAAAAGAFDARAGTAHRGRARHVRAPGKDPRPGRGGCARGGAFARRGQVPAL